MSRHRHGWDDREPGYRRTYSDEYTRRRYDYAPQFLPRDSFNYWRDDVAAPSSYRPQRSYGRESYNERWHDDRRSWHTESSYSRRRHDFGPGRDCDDRELRRDRSPSHRNPSRQRYSTYIPSYNPRPTARAQTPTEPTPPILIPAPPESPREASPPPPPPTQPPEASPGYLSLSQQPSEVLRNPAMSRKLLILDLNGTLLIRSPRSRSSSGKLRAVQPRPYMESFRQYLFCMETKAWLDTMVWSSAQPHSVDDMVEKIFGTSKGDLKAVWNRKSLGLSEAEYHRKAVTTKDLAKAWDLFASARRPEKPQGQASVPSQSQSIHSALTTLLLDDSPHKAVLQPYSHLCIPEYDSPKRQHDLRSFLAKEPKPTKKAKWRNQVEKVADLPSETIAELLPEGALPRSAEKEPYDVTLLAVIGVLETAKLQSNIVGWIRKGGLLATQERRVESGASTIEHCSVGIAGNTNVSSAVVGTGKDASNAFDTASTTVQTHRQSKMWFDDLSVVAFWVARGRRALMELGIQVTHGVTGQ